MKRLARLVPNSDIARRDGALTAEERRRTHRLARATAQSWCVEPKERIAYTMDSPAWHGDDALQRVLRDWCLTLRDRDIRIDATLEHLIEHRRNPSPFVRRGFEYVAAFTMCWGDGGEATAARAA